jgi:hypothetical protein
MKRRDFLKQIPVAGAGIIVGSSALIQACSTSPTSPQVANTQEVVQLQSAGRMEAGAIKSYSAAVSRDLIVTPALRTALRRFSEHHQTHLSEINVLLQILGQAQINPETAIADSRVSTLTTERSVVALALELEYEAATAYLKTAGGVYSQTSIRDFFVNTLAIETAHFTALKGISSDFANVGVLSSAALQAIDSSALNTLTKGF